ncbi:SsrA-binding protein [candidate division SR1 bacterium]|nr:SsrA-binding protein [candidate division SR1 bacterium]
MQEKIIINYSMISKNKRAFFDYEIVAEWTVGIVLAGHEVKSIKSGHINLSDAIVVLQGGELWVVGLDIPLYTKTSPILVPGYQPKRKRKLLITKRELAKLASRLDKPGITALALEIFIARGGFLKIKIGVGKLKRKIEKKQIIKERTIEKEMRQSIRRGQLQ